MEPRSSHLKWLVLVCAAISLVLGGLAFQLITQNQQSPDANLPELTVTEDDSVWRLINAEYKLPESYVPPDLELPDVLLGSVNPESQMRLREMATVAIEKMFEAAKQENINLELASGYRPYRVQAIIYDSAGGDNQSLAAPAGASEHQSGLAADIMGEDAVCRLEQCFGEQPEGEWAAANAHRFGFVLRYPKGKEDITQISYEPWHFRYVGVELATHLYEQKLTLEEYYQATVQ